MILCRLDFPFESRLALPTEDGYYYKRQDRNVFIRCRPISVTTLISYTGEIEELYKEDLMRTEVKAATYSGEKILLRTIYFSKGAEDIIKGGYLEPAIFTQFEIVFEMSSIEELKDKNAFEDWLEELLTDYIYYYKLVSQHTDIIKPRLAKIPIMNIYTAEKYQFGQNGYEAEFQLFKNEFKWKDTRQTGLIKKPLTEEINKILVSGLREGYRPTIWHKILLDAKDYAILYQENDISIILSEMAFEIFIKEALDGICEVNSIKELEVNSERIDYKIAIDKFSVSESIGALSNLTGRKLKQLIEYNEWYTKAYNKRNQILHRRKVGFKEKDATEAWEATVKYLEAIENIVNKLTANRAGRS